MKNDPKSHFRIPKMLLGGIILLYAARGIFWITAEYHALRDDEGMALIILGHDFEPETIISLYAAAFALGFYILTSSLRQRLPETK